MDPEDCTQDPFANIDSWSSSSGPEGRVLNKSLALTSQVLLSAQHLWSSYAEGSHSRAGPQQGFGLFLLYIGHLALLDFSPY